MGRKLLNIPEEVVEQSTLGIYYIQDNGVYGRSGSNNGSFGYLTKNSSGTNYYNNNTSQTGYTIKKANSYLRVRFTAQGDHGQTWRSSALLLKFTTNNFTNSTTIGGFGMTQYNGGHHNYGQSCCYERIWLHGSSVGTVYKFAIEESGQSSGTTWTYNNVNAGQDGSGGTQNDHGLIYGMNIRVEEIEAAQVSQFSGYNTFTAGG